MLTYMSPSVLPAVLRHASTSIKVVFPAPLTPIRAVSTPGRKDPVTLCSSCSSPWPYVEKQAHMTWVSSISDGCGTTGHHTRPAGVAFTHPVHVIEHPCPHHALPYTVGRTTPVLCSGSPSQAAAATIPRVPLAPR